MTADEGDDNGDQWRFVAETNGILNLQDYGAGSWYNNIRLTGNTGGVQLYHNNSEKLATGVSGEYGSFEAKGGTNGWDGMAVGSSNCVFMGNSGAAGIWNDTENAWMLKCSRQGSTELQYNGTKMFETSSTGVTITGNIQAAGTNADIKIGAVGAGGHVKFVTTGSDRWYVEGTNGHFLPQADNTYDIGNSSYRVRNLYTTDLQ